MARCNDCNNFVSLDSEQDPEVSLDVSDDGDVTGSVEIANTCADCGTEVTTASFDVNVSGAEIKDEEGCTLAEWIEKLTPEQKLNLSLEVESEEGERTSRSEGKGRGTRTFYGARVTFDVAATVEVGEGLVEIKRTFSGTFEDEIQASSMETV